MFTVHYISFQKPYVLTKQKNIFVFEMSSRGAVQHLDAHSAQRKRANDKLLPRKWNKSDLRWVDQSIKSLAVSVAHLSHFPSYWIVSNCLASLQDPTTPVELNFEHRPHHVLSMQLFPSCKKSFRSSFVL